MQVTQGSFIARIDLVFFDNADLNRYLSLCEETFARDCTAEKESYDEAAWVHDVEVCVSQSDAPRSRYLRNLETAEDYKKAK